jgi:16S rRNA (uracil1498-N3)-methyltransferase
MVEVGLAKLIFIKTEKGERSRLNEKRLMKKAVSALKQSGNLWLPEIQTEVKFKDFLTSDQSEKKFVAHCFDQEKTVLTKGLGVQSVSVLIGPEGDFSQGEVEMASAAGYEQLSLGIPRYRTETAAVVACTLINHFCVTLAE